jgi:hypothetical protein
VAAILMAVQAAVAGCDDVPVTSVAFRIEDPWAVAQGHLPLPLVVVGRPFEGLPSRTAESVSQTMAGAMTWSRRARFVLVPPEDVVGSLRVVVAFSGGAALCGPSPTGGQPLPNGQVEVRMVLCDRLQTLADVTGRLGRSSGPHDNRFRSLIRQAATDLLMPPPAPRP